MVEQQFIQADRDINQLGVAIKNGDHQQINSMVYQLQEQYQVGSLNVRNRIITGVVETHCSHLIPLLKMALLDDKSELIRHEAAFGLGEVGSSKDQFILLLSLTEDPSPLVQHEAASALGYIGDSFCLPALKAVSNRCEGVVRDTVRFSLDLIRQRMYNLFDAQSFYTR